MRIETRKEFDQFRPVTVSITFETENELDVFYSVFNTPKITSAIRRNCPSLNPDQIRASIREGSGRGMGGVLEIT